MMTAGFMAPTATTTTAVVTTADAATHAADSAAAVLIAVAVITATTAAISAHFPGSLHQQIESIATKQVQLRLTQVHFKGPNDFML